MAGTLSISGTVTFSKASVGELPQSEGSLPLVLKDNTNLAINKSLNSKVDLPASDTLADLDMGQITAGTFLAILTDGGAVKVSINGSELTVDGMMILQASTDNPITALQAARKAAGTEASLEYLIIQ